MLDEQAPFLDGRIVKPDEDSYYDLPLRSDEMGTVYEHCVRAIRNGLRFGPHGLPLMGSGDWNDGMNLVGDEGKGESVWLAFFLYDVVVRFAKLSQRRGDTAFADIVHEDGIAPPVQHRRARLGRSVVPPCLLRQREATRLGDERGLPDRLPPAELGGAVGSRRP